MRAVIHIRQDHIVSAIRSFREGTEDPVQLCPLAIAFCEATKIPNDRVAVYPDRILIFSNGAIPRILTLPEWVEGRLRNFDIFMKMDPFGFELNIPNDLLDA